MCGRQGGERENSGSRAEYCGERDPRGSAREPSDGLAHISELADFRVRRTEDVVKVADMVWGKCIGIDERSGKVRLSRRAAMKERQAAPPEQQEQPAAAEAAPEAQALQ